MAGREAGRERREGGREAGGGRKGREAGQEGLPNDSETYSSGLLGDIQALVTSLQHII